MDRLTEQDLNRRIYMFCCRELDGERNKRDILKLLLDRAKADDLPDWIVALSEHLTLTRKSINRLSAKRSRLQRRLHL